MSLPIPSETLNLHLTCKRFHCSSGMVPKWQLSKHCLPTPTASTLLCPHQNYWKWPKICPALSDQSWNQCELNLRGKGEGSKGRCALEQELVGPGRGRREEGRVGGRWAKLCTPFLNYKMGCEPQQCLQNGCGVDRTASNGLATRLGLQKQLSASQILRTKRFRTQTLLPKRAGNQTRVTT